MYRYKYEISCDFICLDGMEIDRIKLTNFYYCEKICDAIEMVLFNQELQEIFSIRFYCIRLYILVYEEVWYNTVY